MQVIIPEKSVSDSVIFLSEPDRYQVILGTEAQSIKIVILHKVKVGGSDNFYIDIVHRVSHTHAQTIMKSVVQKEGRVVLQGKIIIAEGAIGCTSFLTQRVLLLDPTARAEAIPELEILNNDVRCSHAASITGTNLEQLHYLQSRGFSRQRALSMLASAFLVG